jgi:hypothetical protein
MKRLCPKEQSRFVSSGPTEANAAYSAASSMGSTAFLNSWTDATLLER